MRRLMGRLNKLESVLMPAKGPRRRVRVLIGAVCGTPNLATSTCTRRLSRGALTELVNLDGGPQRVKRRATGNFIEGFPIQEEARAW